MNTLPGVPYPLGATWDGEGVNFALYSENAKTVELCLFDEANDEVRVSVTQRSAFVWHVYVPGLGPGQRYGYRVHGDYDPQRGLRFNANNVLLDPYAKALDGVEQWERGCFAYELGNPDGDLRVNPQQALGAPRGVVIDRSFDWEGDTPPRIPLHHSVIYEAHVRGLTMQHPEVPMQLRGTYAGVAHPAVIRYLRELGITAIELMPVHAFVDDKHLLDKGLRNFWGYNSIGFFAPDVRYRSQPELGSEVREFKSMVKALHRAGIEVILDVVYNHTAEGNHLGPSFCLKGIDNPTYYRLVAEDPRFYFDYTGTGNTLNVRHPQALALIMDSLRYWASEMHVDGFRFDLASALARQLHEVDQLSSFFTLIHQSPTLSQVKLIAEPWDVGEGGYQVGNFPVRWAEWNGKYRDAIRMFWRGDGGRAAEIGYRLTGSSDLYQENGRSPTASINLVTAHDGYTLRDLVSYNEKHNEANGENNQDGNNNEHSWNCGAEGPTEDAGVNALRRRQQRNFLATLFLSQGTPMLVAGDEMGRTQRGNNNAYCQDNEIGWVNWHLDQEQRALLEFTRRLLRLRRAHPSLRRSKFFQGRQILGTDLQDLLWFRHDGAQMSEQDWGNPHTESLGMFLAGRGIDDVDEEGRPLVDDNLLLLLNASDTDLEFSIPQLTAVQESWQLLVDTANDDTDERRTPGEKTLLVSRSLKFFRAPARVIRTGGALHRLNSTYRLQFNPGFGFKAAHDIVDYLADLGITDVYASPLLAASHGSMHGYDLVDYTRLNEELGTESDFRAWTDALQARGLGLLLDWVPNHMGIASGQNRWWDDVLENGPSSLYAEFFDIDWAPPKRDLRNRVLLPILGDQYGEVLERGELKLVREDGSFHIAYYDRKLPVGPKSLIPVLESVVARVTFEETNPARQELESIVSALGHLPDRHETAQELRKERAREKEVIKRRLRSLLHEEPSIADAIDETLVEVNGTPGIAASFDILDELLQNQSYRLASWKVAVEEINYRRFFDINDLAAVRMEHAAVFEQAHTLVMKLLEEKRVQALRLDHTDGLYDPLAYFESLQRGFTRLVPPDQPREGPDDVARPLPLLVEKILELGERLPPAWAVDGTTGYEFAAAVLGLWVDPKSEGAFTTLYERVTGDRRSFREVVYESKRYILRFSLASEINMLARALERIAGQNRRSRDFTLISLTTALAEILAAFPVYRTYFRESAGHNEQDERRLQHAVRVARRRNPELSPTIFKFLEDVLLMRTEATDDERLAHVRIALRFQQLTGPVMAKSFEDTAFYRYTRLISLNEVGGNPAKFGTSIEELHAQSTERARSWPLSMTTTSTHDTKRGEDASARIAVLTEIPDEWRRAVTRFRRAAEAARTEIDGQSAPAPTDEYLFYQALVGAWPFGWDGTQDMDQLVERMGTFMAKATKEAKEQTSWLTPSPEYDEAVQSFVRSMLTNERFIADVRSLCESIDRAAATNGLAQTLLRLCSPGVPDTYQGSELWNQSLVDPDNRRPVDFARRKTLLTEMRDKGSDPKWLSKVLLDRYADGSVKLFVVHRALELRRSHPDVFLRGDYDALSTTGENAFAFARDYGSERLVCVVPRFTQQLTRGAGWPIGTTWGDQRVKGLTAGKYKNVFTGAVLETRGSLQLSDVFADFPVALFLRENQ